MDVLPKQSLLKSPIALLAETCRRLTQHFAGAVLGDGADHGEHHGEHHGTAQVHSGLVEPVAQQPAAAAFDANAYYQQYPADVNTYPSASGFYDPYATVDASLTQEQDRQDVGILGGLTIGVVITVFLAALLGSIVAPALTAGLTT